MGVLDDLSKYRIIRRVHSSIEDVFVGLNEGVGDVGILLVGEIFGRELVWSCMPSGIPGASYFVVGLVGWLCTVR